MPFELVWIRWRELTRFRLACEMALSSYRKSFLELPVRGIQNTKIYDERGATRFECSYNDFLDALRDETQLYRLLIVAHTSLIEEFGRVIVAQLLDEGLITRAAFPGMEASGTNTEAADIYILRVNVEAWGAALLRTAKVEWSIVPGGLGAIVHAFVVRNIIAHGANTYNQTAINRINGAVPNYVTFGPGHPLTLDRELFQQHLSSLRNFGRIICGVPSRVRRNARQTTP